MEEAWWSLKLPEVQLTITTALTPSRLEQLEAQCAGWGGPTSAVVYLPLIGDPEQPSSDDLEAIGSVKEVVAAFHQK